MMRRVLAAVGLLALAQIGWSLLQAELTLTGAAVRAAALAVFLLVLSRVVLPAGDALIGRGRDGRHLLSGSGPLKGDEAVPARKQKKAKKAK